MGKNSTSRNPAIASALFAIVVGALFLILTVPLYIDHQLYFPYVTGRTFLFQALVEVAFAGWLVLALLEPRFRPQKSAVLTAFTALMAVVTLSGVVSYHPTLAFWGSFERMEGVILLLHVWALVLVASSVFQTERIWNWFLTASVAVAMVSVLLTFSDFLTSGQGRFRGPVGNPAYMGIYMLFHVGIAGLLASRVKQMGARIAYGVAAFVFLIAMFLSGTRGTAIGFAAGTVVAVLYFAIRSLRDPRVRRVTILVILSVVIGGAAFFTFRNSEVVQGNRALARIANIDLGRDLELRRIVWSVGWEAAKERPMLGWGAGGFVYAYGQHFDARAADRRVPWFDRVHNIVIEWLIIGGMIGLLGYLAVFGATAYCAVTSRKEGPSAGLTLTEQSIVLFLLTSYFVHNLVVFDVLVSYMMFAVLLAFVHQRSGNPWMFVEAIRIPESRVMNYYGPAILVALVATVYFVNIPHREAARDLGRAAASVANPRMQLSAFEDALHRSFFDQGYKVILLVNRASAVVRDGEMPEEIKAAFASSAEAALQALEERRHPADPRIYVAAARLMTAQGRIDDATAYADRARALAPTHPQMVRLQASLASQRGDRMLVNQYLGEEYELNVNRFGARRDYYTDLVEIGRVAEAEALFLAAPPEFLREYSEDQVRLRVLTRARAFSALAALYEYRVEAEPTRLQEWATLASHYASSRQTDRAIDALERAKVSIPRSEAAISCWISNLQEGRPIGERCR
jgi:O-antigen ligase/tetratricopeptide (TPR) repeat protein